ncbi:hypothetical protein BaRGS_00013775 [Batillaria attramentaria]|uniref:Uncharacterized protein n=1 Tax=Batillaria attramentaria TaxID=370345 RepID=A0ABD0L6J2_9CAEN
MSGMSSGVCLPDMSVTMLSYHKVLATACFANLMVVYVLRSGAKGRFTYVTINTGRRNLCPGVLTLRSTACRLVQLIYLRKRMLFKLLEVTCIQGKNFEKLMDL